MADFLWRKFKIKFLVASLKSLLLNIIPVTLFRKCGG
jgi:hypothetical protein